MILKDIELQEIMGGAITATLLNAIARTLNTILNIGQTIGSSIRRIYSKNYC